MALVLFDLVHSGAALNTFFTVDEVFYISFLLIIACNKNT